MKLKLKHLSLLLLPLSLQINAQEIKGELNKEIKRKILSEIKDEYNKSILCHFNIFCYTNPYES